MPDVLSQVIGSYLPGIGAAPQVTVEFADGALYCLDGPGGLVLRGCKFLVDNNKIAKVFSFHLSNRLDFLEATRRLLAYPLVGFGLAAQSG